MLHQDQQLPNLHEETIKKQKKNPFASLLAPDLCIDNISHCLNPFAWQNRALWAILRTYLTLPRYIVYFHWSPSSSPFLQPNMSVSLSTIWTQYFPPKGPITEANLPPQVGKVFIVTGGSNGLGYELSRQLYGAGGKVYILTRSKDRTETAIAKIKAHYEEQDAKTQRGSLEFVQMDLMDFASVKTAAQEFLAREGPNGRLDVL